MVIVVMTSCPPLGTDDDNNDDEGGNNNRHFCELRLSLRLASLGPGHDPGQSARPPMTPVASHEILGPGVQLKVPSSLG